MDMGNVLDIVSMLCNDVWSLGIRQIYTGYERAKLVGILSVLFLIPYIGVH